MASTEWAVVLESGNEPWDESKVKRDEGGKFAEKDGPDAGPKRDERVGLAEPAELPPEQPPNPLPDRPVVPVAGKPVEIPPALTNRAASYYLQNIDQPILSGDMDYMFADAARYYPADQLADLLRQARPDLEPQISRQLKIEQQIQSGQWSMPDGMAMPQIGTNVTESPESIDQDRLYHMLRLVSDDQRDALASLVARMPGSKLSRSEVEKALDSVRKYPEHYNELDRTYYGTRAADREKAVAALLPKRMGKRAQARAIWNVRNADWLGTAEIRNGELQVENRDGYLCRAKISDTGELVPDGESTGVLSPRWQQGRRRLTLYRQHGNLNKYAGELAYRAGADFNEFFHLMRDATPEQCQQAIDQYEPAWLKDPAMQEVPKPKPWRRVESFVDAERQIEELGIVCRFTLPEIHHKKLPNTMRLTMDQVNAACQRFVMMLDKYPEADMQAFGTMYALDNHGNMQSMARAFTKLAATESGTPAAIEKKARKKNYWGTETGPDPDDSTYATFEAAGDWSGGRIRINENGFHRDHATAMKTRATELGRGERLHLCSESIDSVVDHEFGHCLDDTYEFTSTREIRDWLMNFPDDEVEIGLSRYGNSRQGSLDYRNVKEMFAEAVSESELSDARPLGLLVRNRFDEFRRAKRT